ncbi:tRNA dihydrouridine synthase DusB, partial [Francisella tularensis subsp. holarctica]|nr:tRNA dihydrouridine synthase DusB [Francisella tularensis subsp. holarctica]
FRMKLNQLEHEQEIFKVLVEYKKSLYKF